MQFDLLTSLEPHLLSKVLKKLEVRAGIALYQTCKFMKGEIDLVRPRWIADNLMIHWWDGYRHHIWKNLKDKEGRRTAVATAKRPVTYDFVAPKTVSVSGPNIASHISNGMNSKDSQRQEDFEGELLSDLRKWAAVPLLRVERMGEAFLERVIAAAKPVAIEIREEHYDAYNPLFDNIENLNICTIPISERWTDPRIIFDLGRTRKSVSLSKINCRRQLLLDFIKKWLSGENTGTMEEFSVWLQDDNKQLGEDRRAIIDDETVQADAIDIENLNENETVIGRRSDGSRLRLKCEERSITFHFE